MCFYSSYWLTSLISYFNNFPDIFIAMFLISQKLCFILIVYVYFAFKYMKQLFLISQMLYLTCLRKNIFNISPWLLPLSLLVSFFYFIYLFILFCERFFSVVFPFSWNCLLSLPNFLSVWEVFLVAIKELFRY